MVKRYPIILAFLLITLLVTGAVELFYTFLAEQLTGNQLTEQVKNEHLSGSIELSSRAKKTNKNQEDYTIIIERNLFGKVPSAPKQDAQEPERVLTTTSLDLRLLGTIGGDKKEQRAIILNKKTNDQKIYLRGDAIEHAFIKKVGRGMITLSVDGKDEVLLMQEMKSLPSTGNSHKTPLPDVYSSLLEPDEFINEIEDPANLPPSVIPKRRMTLKPKKQQVVEP